MSKKAISGRDIIAAAVEAERKRCAQIALVIDSGRGNEKEIARAILDASLTAGKGGA